MTFDTTSITKPIRKYRKTVGGSAGIGLSAAAIIWMYHTFVSIDQYRTEMQHVQQQQQQMWNAISRKADKP